MSTKIENAEIESTMLGSEDHGIFTCFVNVTGDGWGCGFGGYALDEWFAPKKRRIGTAYGLEFIKRVLSTLEVATWERLRGTPVRVEMDNRQILRIGHFRKDRWFDPRALYEEMNAAEQTEKSA